MSWWRRTWTRIRDWGRRPRRNDALVRKRIDARLGLPQNGNGMIVIHGLGGRLEINGHIIRIRRGGVFGFVVTMLGYKNAFLDNSIWVDRLSTIEIITPWMGLDFIRFSYPGSPNLTGHPLQDGLADNALLMSPFDHRDFYIVKARLENLIRAIGDPHTLPGKPK